MKLWNQNKVKKLVYLFPLVCICIFYSLKIFNFQIHDFANYYFGAYAIANNFFDSEVYNAFFFNQKLLENRFQNLFVSYYPNTPFLAFSHLPLIFFDWKVAKFMIAIFSSALFIVSIKKLIKHYKLPDYQLFIIPFLFFIPIKNNLLFGQPYFIVFFLLAIGLLFYEKNRKISASILWSFAIMLKVFPIVLFFLLFFKKDFKSMIALGFSCCVLLLISIPFCGFDTWIYFIKDVFPKSSSGIIYDGFTIKAKSMFMLFKNLFVYDEMLNYNPIINSEVLFHFINVSYKVIILSLCAFVTLSKKYSNLIVFSFWIFASLLIAPTNSSYSKLLLIFPFFAISFHYKNLWNKNVLSSLFLLLLVCNIPSHLFYDLPLILKFTKAILLVIAFLLWYKIFRTRVYLQPVLIFLLLFGTSSFLSIFNKKELPKNVFVNDKPPILITDFGVKNNKLFYKFWKKGKEHLKQTDIDLKLQNKRKLEIKDNQIYYNKKQLTFSNDSKLQAKLSNKNEVLYLSDINRGTGFYTIRKIELPLKK